MPRNYQKVIGHLEDRRKQHQKIIDKSIESLDKVRDHSETVILKYADFPAQFDYVDKLFPQANVKEVTVYKSPKRILARHGYSGAGGFFDRLQKVVVICDELELDAKKKHKAKSIYAKLTTDEVLVHELIHYCSDHNNIMGRKDMEEEIAYGNSVKYLYSKGYDDNHIIHMHMMPYLYSAVDQNKVLESVLRKHGYDPVEYRTFDDKKRHRIYDKISIEVFDGIKSVAAERGKQIISIYTKSKEVEVSKNSMLTRRRINLDD